jgi:hypothetical protein
MSPVLMLILDPGRGARSWRVRRKTYTRPHQEVAPRLALCVAAGLYFLSGSQQTPFNTNTS